ncbi:MAG: RNA 2',3'-cyclic phosphodiesterase [Candidatus Hadarchaeota archaeon]
MVRAFVAMEISEDVKQRLISLQGQLPSLGAQLKLVEPENLHLTLKFLGEVPGEKIGEISEKIKEAAAGERAFDISLKGLGVFPNLNYMRVIWSGVSEGGEQVKQIQRKIDAALQPLGFSLEKDFHPHLTLARVKFVREKAKLVDFIRSKSGEEFGTSRVDAVELEKSTLTPKGPVYSTLARVELY